MQDAPMGTKPSTTIKGPKPAKPLAPTARSALRSPR